MIAAAIAFSLFVAFISGINSDETKVSLRLGRIHGFKEKIHDKVVNVFLGIPYAVPPIGGLRFRKPQPITEKWTDPLNAKQWPKLCMQDTTDFDYFSEISEDCLYLNVWTPVNLDEDFTQNLKPVMVFIHGGGFMKMGSAYKHYNGQFLSVIGDVVVVTMNYRLGAFGFLSSGNSEAPGNVGLYDQALVLEWVQENIAYFGGDHKRVTVFGQSAGAWSISLHLLSPLTQHTFNRAILMSGASYKGIYWESNYDAVIKAVQLSKLLGCENEVKEENKNRLTGTQIECLRNADAQKIVEMQSKPQFMLMSKSLSKLPFSPVIGEEFIPNEPRELLKLASFHEGITVLVGTVTNEGFLMHDKLKRIGIIPNTDDFQEALKYFVSNNFKDISTEQINEIVEFYFKDFDNNGSDEAKLAYYTAIGDIYFNCETVYFSEIYSKANNLYHYLFDYPLKNVKDNLLPCDLHNTCHANEIALTFGTVSDQNDIDVSKEWMKIIAGFAKNGTVEWPKYLDDSSQYYEFAGNEPRNRLLDNFRGDACKLWKSIFEKEL